MVIEPMYATSNGRTDDGRRSPLNAPLGGGIITKKNQKKTKQLLTQLYYDLWGIVVIEPMYSTSDERTDGRRMPITA